MSQAKRYNTLYDLAGRNNLDSSHHAAFYLLSCDKRLYEIACECVSRNGIDFAKIKYAIRDFDERTRFIVDIAHNLFSYISPCQATPFEISRLGYPLMEQVCNALYIAADQAKVIIRSDENQNEVIELDTAPYQKTKRTHDMLKKFRESRMSRQDESDELEP